MTHADSRHFHHENGTDAAGPFVPSSFEALCLEARENLTRQSPSRFRHTLSMIEASWAQNSNDLPALKQARDLFLSVKAGLVSADVSAIVGAEPPPVRFRYRLGAPVLVLAGSTEAAIENRLAAYEQPLADALSSFSGYLVSGGTKVGVCALAATAAAQANQCGNAKIELVGYVPAGAAASPDYDYLVRTESNDFSILEPLQMWADLLTSGVAPQRVTLLCFGGGVISAHELALAWALGARVFATDAGGTACERFASLLAQSPSPAEDGVFFSNNPVSLFAIVHQANASIRMDAQTS